MFKKIWKKMFSKNRKANNQKGFTLLEILVVLTIMGFLIAMVAPRLAGISGGAVDTVCDSNQNRMITYMSSFFEQTNRFPNKLTNLVIHDTAAAAGADYQIPVVSDQDPDNGAEVLNNDFYSRNHFHIHYLNATEAKALKNMGIVKVLNLNDYSKVSEAATTPADFDNDVAITDVTDVNQADAMEEDTVASGVGVAMVGCGVKGVLDTDVFTAVANTKERGWGEPDWFGRIVFGLGPECELVTSGIISNAAHCPGGIQNTDNCTYNDYNLVLPRLEATVSRMQDTTVGAALAAFDYDTSSEGIQLSCVAYDDEPGTGYDISGNSDHLKKRTFRIDEAQENWQFATQCPEGHMYPEDDVEFWGIDLSHDDKLN